MMCDACDAGGGGYKLLQLWGWETELTEVNFIERVTLLWVDRCVIRR
jgi:hypothetical protein